MRGEPKHDWDLCEEGMNSDFPIIQAEWTAEASNSASLKQSDPKSWLAKPARVVGVNTGILDYELVGGEKPACNRRKFCETWEQFD
jgi:hypothetical protein